MKAKWFVVDDKYSVNWYAENMRINRTAIFEAIASGELKAEIRGGRGGYKVSMHDMIAFLNKHIHGGQVEWTD